MSRSQRNFSRRFQKNKNQTKKGSDQIWSAPFFLPLCNLPYLDGFIKSCDLGNKIEFESEGILRSGGLVEVQISLNDSLPP